MSGPPFPMRWLFELALLEDPTDAAAPASGIQVVSGGDIVESTPRMYSWLTYKKD